MSTITTIKQCKNIRCNYHCGSSELSCCEVLTNPSTCPQAILVERIREAGGYKQYNQSKKVLCKYQTPIRR